MSPIQIHLTFNGNCKEAMMFYQSCFGGDLFFKTIADEMQDDTLPVLIASKVLLATLTNQSIILSGTDLAHDEKLVVGNAISFLLACDDVKQLQLLKYRLSGGKLYSDYKNDFTTGFVDVTDPFKNQWLLYCK